MSRHTLSLAELSGAELLEVWTAVVEHETGDVARAMAAVEANRASSSAARVTRRRRTTVVQILVEQLVDIRIIRQSGRRAKLFIWKQSRLGICYELLIVGLSGAGLRALSEQKSPVVLETSKVAVLAVTAVALCGNIPVRGDNTCILFLL